MLLNEQKHKNLYRSYFKGYRKDYDKNKSYFKDINFYTTSPLYALFYAEKNGIVSEYKLKNEVDIFNARSKNDFYKLHKYINDNHISISYDLINRLKNEDWVYVLNGDENRQIILNILILLGYDGFFNFEFTKNAKKFFRENYWPIYSLPTTDSNPAVGAFKNIFIHINDYYDINNLLEYNEIVEFKDEEKSRIEYEFEYNKNKFNKDFAYEIGIKQSDGWLTLNKDEAIEILNICYNKKFDLKEALEMLHFLEDVHRPCFKEMTEELRKKIYAQTK